MRNKLKYIITILVIFFISTPILAQRDLDSDPDVVPTTSIDNYIWILILVGVVFAILKLRTYSKQHKPILK
jgi:hypothetical protein